MEKSSEPQHVRGEIQVGKPSVPVVNCVWNIQTVTFLFIFLTTLTKIGTRKEKYHFQTKKVLELLQEHLRKKQFILFLSSQSAKSGHQNLFINSV